MQIRRYRSILHVMWRRLAQKRLRALWRQFPAVLILGARQVGKTTLARQTFPTLPYCDLEEPHLLKINSQEDLDQHPMRGAGWETFVMEDIIRREKLRHPHTQFHFWRTAAGAEMDLLLDRGSQRIGIEIKAGRGDKTSSARTAEQIAGDTGATSVWILDQAAGTESLRPCVRRRGFAESLKWLPA
jgi:predicted AAA+ superfamily ATPase